MLKWLTAHIDELSESKYYPYKSIWFARDAGWVLYVDFLELIGAVTIFWVASLYFFDAMSTTSWADDSVIKSIASDSNITGSVPVVCLVLFLMISLVKGVIVPIVQSKLSVSVSSAGMVQQKEPCAGCADLRVVDAKLADLRRDVDRITRLFDDMRTGRRA